MSAPTIGVALRLIRQYHALKQKDLAKQLGLAPSFLSEIETGKKTPTMDTLQRFAQRFGLTASSIAFFAERMGKKKQPLGDLIDPKVYKMLDWVKTVQTWETTT